MAENSDQPESGKTDAEGEQPIMAKLVPDAASERTGAEDGDAVESSADDGSSSEKSAIRSGSPFAVDPGPSKYYLERNQRTVERFYDIGPLKYTAMGAVGASALVVFFAAAAAYWFPAGGALIAALGCTLAMFGLLSHLRWSACGFLLVHIALFVVSYSRTLST